MSADSASIPAPISDSGPAWRTQALDLGLARFRPSGWTDENVVWGLVGSQVTRVDVRSGAVQALSASAWSVHAAPGVVSWRNADGTWEFRDLGEPVRLAGPEPDPQTGFDGPPIVLWSRDGTRALLGWTGEWDSRFELLGRHGIRRGLQTRIDGYFGNHAALWLDSTRVLFQTVASGPRGGEPTYRESGWRGDLALLDLATDEYRLVTEVPDYNYLRVAGPLGEGLLVTEWDSTGVRGHWRYDARTWQRRPVSLPIGRAFAGVAGAVVVLLHATTDSTTAMLVANGKRTRLGTVSHDIEPVFTPSGRRGALRTGQGVVMFEAP